MPSDREIPDFGQLLGPFITPIPEASRPAMLSAMERFAANRYRDWAKECPPEDRDELLACAAREEEIARRVLALFPATAGDEDKIDAELTRAGEAYAGVFENLSLSEKYFVQAAAERQGASAWRGIAAQQEDDAARRELATCAELEEESATCLEQLLGLEEGATRLASSARSSERHP